MSPSAAETIVDLAATLGASRVIRGAGPTQRIKKSSSWQRHSRVSNALSEEIDLLVYA